MSDSDDVGRQAERDDVIAFLQADLDRHAKAEKSADREENRNAKLERLRSKCGLLRTLIAHIRRGDHVTTPVVS